VTGSISRRQLISGAVAGAASLALAGTLPAGSAALASRLARPSPADAFDAGAATAWFDLMLRLIQQTPGYSPPVASRAIGCAGLGLYEAVLPGMPDHRSLAGVLTDLTSVPADGHSTAYHWPSVASGALAAMMRSLFPTAPTALLDEIDKLESALTADVPRGIRSRSIDRGYTVASAIHDWSKGDGGHEGYLRNFPSSYVPPAGPGLWVRTPPGNLPALQPYWGSNRCMALASATDCDPGPHPAFSTDEQSPFFAEAVEVLEAVEALSSDQEAIALFWADDPGRTATPPGHSVSILTQLLVTKESSLADAAEAYARLGIALCDAFIACWRVKYDDNLVRPITYIRANIDPSWGDPLPVTTPPFPEYTSGHSVQSAAAAEVLTALFGSMSFTDHTHDALGLAPRSFESFQDFANEAAISRLYGGIHYRAAIERGLSQGRCIGSLVASLPMTR
jgi:hypothetical protein